MVRKLLARFRRLKEPTVLAGSLRRELLLLSTLRDAELYRLDSLASEFLRRKAVDGAGGLAVDRKRVLAS